MHTRDSQFVFILYDELLNRGLGVDRLTDVKTGMLIDGWMISVLPAYHVRAIAVTWFRFRINVGQGAPR